MSMKKDVIKEKGYWDNFYKNSVIDVPSQFCVSMATDNHNRKTIVEFGMGSGRDSLYLATQGFIVVAVDISESAVSVCTEKMNQRGVKHTTFLCADMTQDKTVSNLIKNARLSCHDEYPEIIVYSRFVLHSLDLEQETQFLTSLSKYMNIGDVVYFEFRSEEDVNTDKYFGNTNHFRRYVDSERFSMDMIEKYGFNITYSITGKGMAKYKNEDPVVTRVIATKL